MSNGQYDPSGNGTWTQWSKHVLSELERLNTCYDSLDDKLDEVRIEIAKLKVKAGVWGAAAGAIPMLIMLIIHYFPVS